jgi:hypothetical protein
MEDPKPSSAPPTSPFEAYPDDRAVRVSRWPFMFGAISLVLGVFGFCMQGVGALYTLSPGTIMKMAGMDVSAPPDSMRTLVVVQAVILCSLGVLLIAGSALLMKRNPLGPKLVMVVAGLVLGVLFMKPQAAYAVTLTAEIRDSLRKQGIKEDKLPPLASQEEAESALLRNLAIASIAFSIWPFVMAIVLTRPHVKADVEAWSRPS